MGFNDFSINDNGKKEQLNNAKHGVRKEQVDKKHHNLFDAYDINGNGTLEDNELQGLFTGLTKFSGADKTLDIAENKQVSSLFADKTNIKDADFMGFVKSVSDASEEIVSSQTTKGVDGGDVITTTYKNGMIETIYYYPDGEFKLKTQKQDSVTESTTYFYTNDGKEYKQCSQAELDKMIKADYKKYKAANGQSNTKINGEISLKNILMGPEVYKSDYMKRHDVMPQTNRSEIHIDTTDMSERAKAEAEIRDFVVSHFVQTHKDCQSALDTMGILDDIGAAINAGAGELWNSCKNIYNKHFGDGTESDYQNFYELVKKFEPNYDKALVAESNLEEMRLHPVGYFTGETGRIDTEKGLQFQQTTEQYQNATILKSRIDILKNAMLEISMYENEQNALMYAPAQSEGMNPASHILNANNLLLQYFDGDKDAVNMLLNGAIGDAQSTISAIKGIADDTQKMFDTVTNGKSFDEIKKDYQTQYKEMYGADFVPDELTEKVMDAKATGGMVKLAAITAISILVTKSPVMAEISAAAGGAEVTGAAANMIRTLASRYGATAVQQGIKFAMTSGTLATDVGLTLLNQVTSERGVDGEELWESAKGSAKYIYFGAYIGAPMAQAVSKQLGKIGATAKLFEGGVKSANGAIQTTSITGDKLVQNLMKGGNKVLTTGGAFLTDVAAFSALEVATEGMDPITAGKEQTEMLGKLKIMNHFIEYMLGGKVHVGMSKVQMDAAIEHSGVKSWDIREINSPNKTIYEVEVGEGLPLMRFEDKNQLATAMLEKVTASYSGNADFEIKTEADKDKNEVADTEKNTRSASSTLDYEVSRNINRGKRAIQYLEDKAVDAYQGTKKVAKGIVKLLDSVSLDRKLKSLGIKGNFQRENIVEFLEKTPIESDEIYDGLLKSIKTMKELQVVDNDITDVLYKISNNNQKFDQSSLDVITELSNLYKKAGENWDERTARSLLFNGKNNDERLEYLKEYSATLDDGYKFDDVKYMLSCGIKGKDGRKAYEEILNSEFTQRTKGGLGAEFSAKEYFKICCDAEGKFNQEYWNVLQNMDKAGVRRPQEILKVLKNKDIEITKSNIEIFMDKFAQNPRELGQYNIVSLIQKCITKEGKLDFSLMEDAQAISQLGYGFDVKHVTNKDGSYNQSAINMIQELKNNGFKNEDLNNILVAAVRTPSTRTEGELYSQDIIQKAIELKNAGIKTEYIGNMLNDCIENGKLNIEFLENITPICKMLDCYTMCETEWLMPMLKSCDSETQIQAVAQIQKLMQNGFNTFDIQRCEIFNFKGNFGSIVPDNIINAAIQLKQAGFDWNIKNILTKSRYDDGTLNTESLNFLIDLKNKGIPESNIDNVLGILTTEKGEFLKDNTEIVLSLLKEFKDSEFCNSPKDKNEALDSDDYAVFSLKETKIESDYISEHGNNVVLVNTLIKMSSDEAGKIDLEVLNANKAKLANLYNKLEAEDKNMFVAYLKRAANKQGSFDENFFNKIDELKYLDDGCVDPNYSKTIMNFLDACKDENGNLDIQKYNDAVMLVKKHRMSKHQATYTIGLYEELKPYQGKSFVHDLSITEKRQLQSLLLSHSNDLKGLTEVRKILKADIIPTTDVGYSTLMKQLSQSLGDTNFVLDKPALDNLHNDMSKLTQTLQSGKPIEEVSVDVTYQDLLKRINSKMSGLSASEKRKIYDYFGFTVKNGEIAGFPSHLGKNIEATDITDSFTKKVVQAVTDEIENFNKNNKITIKNNPELSQILTSISKSVPEVYNKFSSPVKSTQTLKSLKTITEEPSFAQLSDNEKQVLILSAFLKDSNVGTTKETAFNIYNLASKFDMSNADRQNLYRLLTMPDLITEYKNIKVGEKGSFNNRFGSPTVEYDKKELALDMLAFGMKDHNLNNLSYLLYSTGENKLISPELQAEIKQRIHEIKSDDFILPQTHTQSIREHAKTQTINGYEVLVVNAQDIPDFYAYVHTPDAGAVNHSSRTTKFSNFEEFQNIDSDAVICTSYISADKSATWLDNGFVFDISTGNEYVGMGHDMFSLGKNKSQVVAEYYRNKGLKALSGKGYKYSHRSFISSHLKDILHITENSYSNLISNKRSLNRELENLAPNSPEAIAIQSKIAEIDSEIQRINDDYVTRMDRVKSQISSEQINFEEIRSVDPELANAYETFLARDNTGHKFGKEALMRNDYWNEVLVGNPTISAIYTKDINNLPAEYLEKAKNEGIPIVVIPKKSKM